MRDQLVEKYINYKSLAGMIDMENKRPYLDFYDQIGDKVVSRIIEDELEFFRTRSALYMSLGIAKSFLKDKAILEFGPGSGHNSIFTASLGPSKYVLVDGGKKIIEAAKRRLSKSVLSPKRITYINSLFEEYQSDEYFDLVIAEACIPMQEDPAAMLRTVAAHVKPGGVLIITTISAVSYLSEIMRRLGRDIQMKADVDSEKQLEILRPLYQSHLATLTGLSRSVDDWLLDNIVQPLNVQKLLTIPEAIESLVDNFELLGSSPRFVTDWRWHKTMIAETPGINNTAERCYYSTNINLLDYRFETKDHDPVLGKALELECSKLWNQMITIENDRHTDWHLIWPILDGIARIIAELGPRTTPAFDEARRWVQGGALETALIDFPYWWGRGQQYLSFVRR